ncbi:MAG TPA: hypothetical protein VF175_15695 [Lacipirellula sp.]
MVAFSSSRRHRTQPFLQTSPEALAARSDQALAQGVAASRRNTHALSVTQASDGSIKNVRIGAWRLLSAGPERRIAEVRQLPSGPIAVRIERLADSGSRASSEIWQLYDPQGGLDAALQTAAGGALAILTNYRTRQACRMLRNGRNEFETVETWSI